MNAVLMIRLATEYDSDFNKAWAKLQEMVSKIWQKTAHQANMGGTPGAARKVSQVKQAKAQQGGARGGKSGQGGSGGGKSKDTVTKDGKKFFDGVDVTDVDRTFTHKEWKKIKPIMHEYIFPNRAPQEANVSALEKKKNSNGNKFGTNQYD